MPMPQAARSPYSRLDYRCGVNSKPSSLKRFTHDHAFKILALDSEIEVFAVSTKAKLATVARVHSADFSIFKPIACAPELANRIPSGNPTYPGPTIQIFITCERNAPTKNSTVKRDIIAIN